VTYRSRKPYREPVTTMAALRKTLGELREGALQIHCVSNWSLAPGVPILHVDPGDRADAAVMPRAVNNVGMHSEAWIGWQFVFFPAEAEGIIDISITGPLSCTFSIAISARHHRELIKHILAAQRLGLVTTCPHSDGSQLPAVMVPGITFRVAREALQRVWGEGEPA
jgi:hypothetical protein